MKTDQERRDMFAAAIAQGWAASGQVNLFSRGAVQNVFESAEQMLQESKNYEKMDRDNTAVKR